LVFLTPLCERAACSAITTESGNPDEPNTYGNLEVPNMSVSSARKAFSRRILSGVAGLILIAAPLMVTAAAADPYNTPDDVAAYQAYTRQGQCSQYG
jgi:hypothetical protein